MKTFVNLFISLTVLLTMSGCQDKINDPERAVAKILPTVVSGTVQPKPIVPMNVSNTTLTTSNIVSASVKTISQFPQDTIAAFAVDQSNQKLYAALKKAKVVSIDLVSEKIQAIPIAIEVNLGNTIFDRYGNVIATTGNYRKRAISMGESGTATQWRAYNLRDYTLIEESLSTSILRLAFELNEDGTLIIQSYDGGGGGVNDLENKRPPMGTGFTGGAYGTVDALAVDSTNTYIAYATRGGMVNVNSSLLLGITIGNPILCRPQYGEQRPKGSSDPEPDLYNPLALKFSPDLRWLALVRDEQLLIYDLGHCQLRFTHMLGSKISPAASLAFSPDGQMLAVATKNGVKVFDVITAKEKYSVDEESYAIVFSHDQRMLVYGNAQGQIKKIVL